MVSRAIVKEANGFFLDFFDAFLAPLESELEVRSAHVTGRATPGDAADPAHCGADRRDKFRVANDDGAGARDYRSADLMFIGVSRTSKTPTSLYLALQYGIFTANYPLTDEELEPGRLPKVLQPYVGQAVWPNDRGGTPAADPARASTRQSLCIAAAGAV